MKCLNVVEVSLCAFLLVQTLVKGEVFTAVVELENLLRTESEIIRTLETYLEAEEERLEKVRGLRKDYEKFYQKASEDVESFLSNPVNAFLLVKRLTADWKAAEYLIEGSGSKDLIRNISQQDLKFPDEEDLSGAATALMRLQDTYLLDTSTLAQGKIEGTRSSPELSAGDCFELAHQAYGSADYYHTLLWMQEALERLEREDTKTANKAEILEHMAYSTYMRGNIRHALKLTNDLLDVDPDHPRAKGNQVYYEQALDQEEQQKRGDDGDMPSESEEDIRAKEINSYERLCRGEKLMDIREESKLHCHYVTNNSSFLLLQPVKAEELHLNPTILIFHDILSNGEIELIKHLAQPRLKRATVQNSQSGELETAHYRISKSAWLKNEDHTVVKRVSQRIQEVTGLNMDTAEELQVVNYGIGGHYEPHFDFARKDEPHAFDSLGTGNRIATWLNYMSDVDAGGSTVFTNINVQVKPKKGSAAFWHNLYKNGDGITETRHAACPVLAGSKWVSNKWIHERGQEFRRPCAINPNE